MSTDKYDYNRFGSSGKRVGQAVTDILSKEQPEYKVEDILEPLGKDWLDTIRKTAETFKDTLESPFFILSLLTKDLGYAGVANVLKHSARAFQNEFSIKEVTLAHKNPVKTMFKVDKVRGDITLMWTVPGYEECKSILKNAKAYDPNLVKWVKESMKKD